MIDREKVIKILEICLNSPYCHWSCPYKDEGMPKCQKMLMKDGLALLKEADELLSKQQPIKASAILLGETEVWGSWFKCSACGYEGIHESAKNFCPNCGAKLEAKDD